MILKTMTEEDFDEAHGGEPVFHLRSYGDVSAKDLEAYASRARVLPKPTWEDEFGEDHAQGRTGDAELPADLDGALWRQGGMWLCLFCALGMCGLIGAAAYGVASWAGWAK